MKKLLLTTLIALPLAGGSYAILSAAEPAIGEAEARAIALAEIAGEVYEYELERENGKALYEYEIKTSDGEMVEIEIDGETGEILEIDRDGDDDEDDDSDDHDNDKN